MIDDCDDEDIKPKAEYFKRFITRVVATDEYGRRILQGLLHLHFNQKKIRVKISMELILMILMLLTILMPKCVGSKSGRRRGWGGVVLCWTSLTKTGATALLLYSQPGEEDHGDDNHDDGEGEDDDGDNDAGGGGGS